MLYLYKEGEDFIFMNQETYDQLPIAKEIINGVDFLLEGMVVDVVSDASTETILYADVPVKVQMKITYTEPGLKGDTWLENIWNRRLIRSFLPERVLYA